MEKEKTVTTWHPIDTAPKGRGILVYYKNACDKGRIVKAKFIEKYTEEDSSCEMDFSEYHEERDIYYWPKGWYELVDNWDEFTAIAFSNKPTHWMPLPEPPHD